MAKEGTEHREKWSSWVAFVWAAAGAAVGLGNIWKFPYMAGSNGGSAFVLMYLIFVILIAVPVMVAEIMLGKLSKKNAVDGFHYLAIKNNLSGKWSMVGYLGLLTLLLIFCFYSVVAGFSISYLYLGFSESFVGKSPIEIQDLWVTLLSKPQVLISCSVLFILFTMVIVYFGVKKGIERACTLLMPCLLAVLMVLVFYALSWGGFTQAIDFLFAFKPQELKASVVIAGLGHAFFTLAVGACAMMVYGSYLPQKTSVIKTVFVVSFLDVLVALLAGLAIFPIVFVSGLAPDQGPGLMFITLPVAFANIPFGWFWSGLFFLLLFFAALSSSLSFAEPLVNFLMEKGRINRKKSTLFVGLITLIGSMFCALSFNILNGLKILGRFTVFDFFADLSTNVLLPLGGIGISIFAGLIVKQNDLVYAKQTYGRLAFNLWRLICLVVAPAAIFLIMVNGFIEFLGM